MPYMKGILHGSNYEAIYSKVQRTSTSAVSLHCKENQHIFDVVQNVEIVETCTKNVYTGCFGKLLHTNIVTRNK